MLVLIGVAACAFCAAFNPHMTKLSKQFGVRGIPMLVVLDGQDGSILTTEGREKVDKYFKGGAADLDGQDEAGCKCVIA